MQDLIWLATHIALPVVVFAAGVAFAMRWIMNGTPVLGIDRTDTRPLVSWGE